MHLMQKVKNPRQLATPELVATLNGVQDDTGK